MSEQQLRPPLSDLSLEGKVYVVFGGSGGIGSAVARSLSKSGARVVVTGRDQVRLDQLNKEYSISGISLDIEEDGAIDRCIGSVIDQYERVDGVVNCIGSLFLKPAHLTSDSQWDEVVEINLSTAFKVLRASVGAMMKSGGSIVLLSSAAAQVGMASHEAIAASKAGVVGLCLSAAASYSTRGIRVNCVSPGLVQTQLTRHLTSSEASRHASESMHALGRLGEPDDVAGAIVWLLSPQSSWVTGQVLGVDGGLSSVRTKRG